MKHLTLVLGTALALVAGAANAQTKVSDTDGNGTFSIEEMTAAYADMTPALFAEIDVNSDGQVDADELQAAKEAGKLPN